MVADNKVYFAHGKDSEPWGIKIKRLAAVAGAKGFEVESPDYRGLMDPEGRVEKLLNQKPVANKNLVLVGSSMGGYVSIAASQQLQPAGLFLLAPAVFLPTYPSDHLQPVATFTEAVHGWRDEIVPVDHVIRFAKPHCIQLHLLDSDHHLIDVLPEIEALFAAFLDKVLLPA